MAVTWTPFADGVSLLTLRNAFNTFNSAVKGNIDTIETNITGLGTSKLSLSYIGIVASDLVTPIVKALTTAYSKIKMVDTVRVNVANGHIVHSTTADTWTVNTTGVYSLTYSGSMTAPNGSIVTFNYNVNGVSAITTPAEFVGRGTSPVALDSHTVLSLTAGQVVYIEAKGDSAFSITPQSGTLVFEKLPY